MPADTDTHPINANDWSKAYPAPKDRSDAPLALVSVDDVARRIDGGQKAGQDFVVVDVRRSDCTALIPGAINLPAHSLYVAAPTLVHVLSNVPQVLFHCNQSNGRGPRAAGWYADALQQHLALSDEQVAQRVAVLQGGIVAWEKAFGAGPIDQRGQKHTGNTKSTIQL